MAARVLPIVLAGFMGGCVMVPTPYVLEAGTTDLRHAVKASAVGRKSLVVGTNTQSDVERVLGQPVGKSQDGRSYVYSQQMFSGLGVIFPPLYPACGPLCQRTYYLRLDFNRDQRLVDTASLWGDPSDAGMGYMMKPPAPVPASLLERQ